MDPHAPVLIGVGQVVHRDETVVEPLALMEQAARLAAEDAGLALDRVQCVAVVDAISQQLSDPGAALAQRMGISARTARSGLGGNGPQRLVNDLATQIAAGELDVALVAGAEAMATLTRLMKQGEQAPWASETVPPERPGSSDAENAAGLIAPIFFYPLIEHALRGEAGRTREEHLRHISELWAGFSEVAAGNPHAWSRQRHTAQEIATESASNRRVSDPYLKLHNSHIGVDMGAALLLCSAGAAQAAGVPRERWVYLHAAAHGNDHWFVTTREHLHRSPAIRLAGEALGRGYDHVDLYSCFPSAVQIAARELGLDGTLTVTGGLTFAGGPGNNYATHGIASLAERLRADPGSVGLATALGWYVTKHALGVYSTAEPEQPFRAHDVQEQVDALPQVAVATDGEGAVEAYTALYERDGSPGMGVVSLRTADGARVVAKSHDPAVLEDLLTDDPLGRTLRVREAQIEPTS